MAKDKETSLLEDATLEQLVSLVKASLKLKHVSKSGHWLEFLKARNQTGGTDPNRHTREVLEAFVSDLADKADGSGTSEARAAARDFAERYLKWAKDVRKDERKGRGALPEPEVSTSSSAGQQQTVWSLARRTRAHPKYDLYFKNLPSYSSGWSRVKRGSLPATVRPRLLALDCEMCATDVDESALLGVCVVDEFGDVVYRQLVRPPGNIKDLRTQLTGVSEADMEGVTATAKDAQRAIRKLLEAPPQWPTSTSGGGGAEGRPLVLVGHALHHDLQALKIDYQPVIDTSMVFGYMGLPEATPALKDLAHLLLGLEMREGGAGAHDSQEDAAVSMRLVMRELQLTAPTPPLDTASVRVPAADLTKLCVHSLPEGATEERLRQVFAAVAAPAFQKVEGSFADRKVLVVFRHAGEANEAFKKFAGEPKKDVLGRFYKEAMMGGADPAAPHKIKIRKMACHGGAAFGTNIGIKKAAKQQQPQGAKPKGPKPQGAKPQQGVKKPQGVKRPQNGADGAAAKDGGAKAKKAKTNVEVGTPAEAGKEVAAVGGDAAAATAAAGQQEADLRKREKRRKQKERKKAAAKAGSDKDPVKEAGKGKQKGDAAAGATTAAANGSAGAGAAAAEAPAAPAAAAAAPAAPAAAAAAPAATATAATAPAAAAPAATAPASTPAAAAPAAAANGGGGESSKKRKEGKEDKEAKKARKEERKREKEGKKGAAQAADGSK